MELKPGYKQTEVGVIPQGWDCINVCKIAAPIRNAIVGGPFGSDLGTNDYVENGVPVIRGQNMGSRSVSGHFVFVTYAKAKSLESNLARPNDLIFTQRGTLGQVSLVPNQPFDRYLVSQSQMKLTLNRNIAEPLFFYYVFASPRQQEFIRQNTIQTGIPHINLGILRTIPVQCPQLPEQEAIAAALSDADALIESLEQLIAKKRQIKQGAVQELLTGKRRLPGFADGAIGYKQTEVGVIPEDWEVKYVAEITTTVSSGRSQVDSRFGNYPVYGSTGIIGNCTKGDYSGKAILIARVGANAGKISVVDGQYGVTDNTIIIRIDGSLPFDYFWRQLEAKRLNSMVFGSGQPLITGTQIKNVVIPLPPTKAEQEAIAEILSDLDAEITALETKLAKARQIKQGMMHNLLTGKIRLV